MEPLRGWPFCWELGHRALVGCSAKVGSFTRSPRSALLSFFGWEGSLLK